MNARAKPCLDIEEAYEITRLAYPPGWRLPPTDEIERARTIEHRADQRCDDNYVEALED